LENVKEGLMRGSNMGLSFGFGTILLLSGCTAIDRINAPTLSGNPATSALVVVDCEAVMHGMFGVKSPQQVVQGQLLDSDGFNPIEGRAISGLMIFPRVPPGRYYLARVNTVWQAGTISNEHTYVIPPEKVPILTVNTKAGEPRFLGIVTVEEIRNRRERGINVGLRPGKEAELKAWQRVLRIYQDSPWDKSIRQRIAEIEP
jgi:hypothetical protein